MLRMGIESTIPMFDWSKTVRPSDIAVTLIVNTSTTNTVRASLSLFLALAVFHPYNAQKRILFKADKLHTQFNFQSENRYYELVIP